TDPDHDVTTQSTDTDANLPVVGCMSFRDQFLARLRSQIKPRYCRFVQPAAGQSFRGLRLALPDRDPGRRHYPRSPGLLYPAHALLPPYYRLAIGQSMPDYRSESDPDRLLFQNGPRPFCDRLVRIHQLR